VKLNFLNYYLNVEFISGDEVEVVVNIGGDKIFD